MKKYIWSLALFSLLVSCKDSSKESTEQDVISAHETIDAQDLESAVIYEANIRQYSEAGTFNEFTKDIPQLKELGVDIIWLMPIYPISEKNRKAKGDLFVEDIEDPAEREKYLGSYYAVADYTAVNPEFGTKEDFDRLVATAHDNGIFVILDWVANHTGWDNKWITEHPEWYTTNENGEIIHPEGTDWTDTADLNYDVPEMRAAMTAAMKYWITEHQVDGFRCDVAHEVPTDFWNDNNAELRATKDIFMLAESEKRDLFYTAFDMGYNWEGHHIMNDLAQGKTTVDAWDKYMQRVDSTYQEDDILMNFITNHDENSWNGTVEERMGEAADLMLVFNYVIPGMPLIYSGQEYGMNHRLKFFEKDRIPKTKGNVWERMTTLADLKANNTALDGGKNAASYQRLNTADNSKIYAVKRNKGADEIIFVANFASENVTPAIQDVTGTYKEVFSGAIINFDKEALPTLDKFDYYLLEPVK